MAIVFAAFPASADRAALDRFLSETGSLTGVFEQTLLDADGGVFESSRGRFSIDRPGRFRWDYEQPYEQLVVSNGERLWHYDQGLAQVTVRPMGDVLSATPAALLSGGVDLDDTFHVADSDAGGVLLTPRDDGAEFESARLQFDGGVPVMLEIRDALGQTTRIEFSDVTRNVRFRDGWFSFEPPEGVEVVGDS